MTASRRIRVSRWALATNLLASVAVAQTTVTPSASRASADTLEEIIVTAEKRASTVQETAISMTALSGAQLAAAQHSEVHRDDLAHLLDTDG
jgi:iron complex outermembrane recepter protein